MPDDILDVKKHYRKALDYARGGWRAEFDGTPLQRDEFYRLLAEIVFQCGEGHALTEIIKRSGDDGTREGLQELVDAIDQNILECIIAATAYYRKVARQPVQPSGDAKSPWRM